MRRLIQPFLPLLLGMLTVDFSAAQDGQTSQPPMAMMDMNPAGMFLMNLASGTSVNPASWPMPMIMTHFGNWNAAFMGVGFLSDIQQSGPRGGDKTLFDQLVHVYSPT